jgi:hypothetical protein
LAGGFETLNLINMIKSKAKWFVDVSETPLGDTGDYMTTICLTDGEVHLYADGSTEVDEVKELCDLINWALSQPDSTRFVPNGEFKPARKE